MHLVLLKAVYEPVHCQKVLDRRKVLSSHTSAAFRLHRGGIVSFVFVTGGIPPVSVASHMDHATGLMAKPIGKTSYLYW